MEKCEVNFEKIQEQPVNRPICLKQNCFWLQRFGLVEDIEFPLQLNQGNVKPAHAGIKYH